MGLLQNRPKHERARCRFRFCNASFLLILKQNCNGVQREHYKI